MTALGTALIGLLRAGPAAAERAVQRDGRRQVLALHLQEPELRVEQPALRVEHLEVARDPARVPPLGDRERGPQRLLLRLLRDELVVPQPYAGDRVTRLAEGDEHR